MKKSRLLFSVFYFLPITLFSQEFPFGVERPLYWLESKQEANELIFQENIEAKKILTKPFTSAQKTNDFLSFPIESKDKISFLIDEKIAEQYSLFIVYETDDSRTEQNLWSLSKTDKKEPLIVATNHRLADYTGDQFRSYPEKLSSEKVKIHYYQHYKKWEDKSQKEKEERQTTKNFELLTKNYTLNIGQKIETFPQNAFVGKISEVLIYDRVLSTIEMQQVASYLAMKYGVSLHQNHYKNYYNPKGEMIWDYDKHKSFNQNITGLGRFEKGRLSQIQSKNSNDEQVVGMRFSALSSEEKSEDIAVFWSDNGGDLLIKNQKEGQPQGISRVWQLDLPKDKNQPLDWYFNPSSLDVHQPSSIARSEQPKDYHWLVIDSTGTASFLPKNTQYIRLNEVENHKMVSLQFPTKGSEGASKSLHYTIWNAPEMFAHLNIALGKCQSDELSTLRFNVVGGVAPYQIRVKSLDKNWADQTWQENTSEGIKELKLKSGRYIYEIKDQQQRIYKQELFLTDTDAPNTQLNAEYILGKEPIILDIEKQLPKGDYRYEWYRNGDMISQSPRLLLTQSGDYKLKISSGLGCHSVVDFSVYDTLQNEKEPKIILYPNPTTDGMFRLMASFPKITSGTLEIYDMAGRLIQTRSFYNLNQWDYEGRLNTAGVYVLHLKTTLGEKSYKLMVND